MSSHMYASASCVWQRTPLIPAPIILTRPEHQLPVIHSPLMGVSLHLFQPRQHHIVAWFLPHICTYRIWLFGSQISMIGKRLLAIPSAPHQIRLCISQTTCYCHRRASSESRAERTPIILVSCRDQSDYVWFDSNSGAKLHHWII